MSRSLTLTDIPSNTPNEADLCPRCRYDLRSSIAASLCPECGVDYAVERVRIVQLDHRYKYTSRLWLMAALGVCISCIAFIVGTDMPVIWSRAVILPVMLIIALLIVWLTQKWGQPTTSDRFHGVWVRTLAVLMTLPCILLADVSWAMSYVLITFPSFHQPPAHLLVSIIECSCVVLLGLTVFSGLYQLTTRRRWADIVRLLGYLLGILLILVPAFIIAVMMICGGDGLGP